MRPEMQNLIRHLKDQQCPPAVLDRVKERIARDAAPRNRFRPVLAGTISIACLLLAFTLWQIHLLHEAQLLAAERAAAQARAQRALVLEQTEQAVGYIGHALLRAATHTQNALLKEAVPPLRNSFETVKNKVTNPI
jgi:hypothetical protein